MLDTLQPSPLPAMVSTTSKELLLLAHAYDCGPTGLPLLYVGGLTVPLGFARSDEMRINHKPMIMAMYQA